MEIKNEQDNKNRTENLSESDKKRTFINIAVTPEEKISVTKSAITDCGISVSEYCRTKIFTPKREQNIETTVDVLTDPEKEIYEKKITEQTNQINLINDELIKVKIAKSTPTQSDEYKLLETENKSLKEQLEKINAGTLVSENDIYLKLTPEERKMIDLAIEYERACRRGENHKNLDRFICQKILTIIKDNERYFSEDYKKNGSIEFILSNNFYAKLKGEQQQPVE
jgi:hypothetical protein